MAVGEGNAVMGTRSRSRSSTLLAVGCLEGVAVVLELVCDADCVNEMKSIGVGSLALR